MTKNDIKKIIRFYSIMYPATKTIPDTDTVNAWFEMLCAFDVMHTKQAIKQLGVEIDRIPNVVDIVRYMQSDDFIPGLFDTFNDYPYAVNVSKNTSSIEILVDWGERSIKFKYPLERESKAREVIKYLKEKITKSEIMCLWDEDMANGDYGKCKEVFNL